jgi:hypothetical protein
MSPTMEKTVQAADRQESADRRGRCMDCAAMLSSAGAKIVATARSAAEAIEHIRRTPVDAAVLGAQRRPNLAIAPSSARSEAAITPRPATPHVVDVTTWRRS